MTWEDIPGWFDWPQLYDHVVSRYDGGILVEVGNYLGRSLCYLGDQVKRSGKPFYVVGVDWGYTEPGVFQVWGVDGDGRMFLVREVYRSGLAMGPLASGSESWMSIARRLDDEYHPDAWICDPARPEHIDQFRHYGIPAKEADNRRETGIEGVRRRLVRAGDGLPRLFVLNDALESRDPLLERAGKPMGFIGEIPQYTYLAPKNEKPTDDRTDPKKADHSMDAARYACAWVDRHHVAERDDGEYAPWSCGDVLRHDELV